MGSIDNITRNQFLSNDNINIINNDKVEYNNYLQDKGNEVNERGIEYNHHGNKYNNNIQGDVNNTALTPVSSIIEASQVLFIIWVLGCVSVVNSLVEKNENMDFYDISIYEEENISCYKNQ